MSGKRRVIGNSVSLLANRLTQSATSFVLAAAIARTLGPYALGQYALAFSYYFLFMSLVSNGFKTLFTRELSRDPAKTSIYLISGTLLQFLFSLVGYIALVLVVSLLPYRSDTSLVCYILGLTIVPFSLSNITEAIFQAQEKMHLIAISTVPFYVLRLLIMIWAMSSHYGINTVAIILVLSEFLILFVEWGLMLRLVKFEWQIDSVFMWQTLKLARTLLAIEGIAVLSARMQILFLSVLANEVTIGLYSAVDQLVMPFYIVSQSLVLALFPSMTKAVTSGREQQRQVAENIVETLLCVALPLTIGVFFVGRELLVWVYHNPAFADAAWALNIIILGTLASSFARPLSYILVANGFERVNLREITVTTILGGLSNILLIPIYQLIGASTSAFGMQISGFSQYIYATHHRLFPIQWVNVLRRPIAVSAIIAATFISLKMANIPFLLTVLIASLVYCLAVGLIYAYALGGPSVVLTKLYRKRQS